MSICPTSNLLYGEGQSFLSLMILPSNLKELKLEFLDVDPTLLEDFDGSHRFFKSLSDAGFLRSFSFKLVIYKVSFGLKQMKCLKLMK